MTMLDRAPERALRRVMRCAILPAFIGPLVALGCGSAPPRSSAPASASAPVSASAPASASASAPVSASVSASASAPVSAQAVPASGPRRRAKLRFNVGDLPFPAPLVDVVVAGQPTTMIVDTGATHHVIADWLARELSVKITTNGDRAIDHAGRSMTLSRAENITLAVSGWGPLEMPLMLIAPLPEPLRRMGIGGVLAPHLLATAGRATLLDIKNGSMSEEDPEDGMRHLEAFGGARAISGVRACGNEREGLTLMVSASIEGTPALLKIDTGAELTSIVQASPAGKLLLGRAIASKKTTTGLAAAGSFTVPMLEDAKLSVGELATKVDLNVEQSRSQPSCEVEGFLGFDVLHACALLLQGEKTTGRCSPSETQ